MQQTTVAPTASIIARRMLARHAAARHAVQRPSGTPASKPAQNPRNGPNENGKKTRSPGADARGAVDRLPAVEHPLPALVGVDPAERPAGRRRRLAVARVALERLGERRAPRRVRRLVGDELGLGRERQPREIVGQPQRADVDAGRVELARVERVAAVDRRQQPREPLALCASSARDRGARRSARRWTLEAGTRPGLGCRASHDVGIAVGRSARAGTTSGDRSATANRQRSRPEWHGLQSPSGCCARRRWSACRWRSSSSPRVSTQA